MSPRFFAGQGWKEAVEDAVASLFGRGNEEPDEEPYYKADTNDLGALRGAGTLYYGPERVVNARRCIAGAEQPVYAVGDVAAESLLNAGAAPALVVTDGKTHRTAYDAALDLDEYTAYAAENPAGGITEEAYNTVRDALEDAPAHLDVEGEEDLLSLAVADHAEHGTLVYGDPGIDGQEGLRAVNVADVADAADALLDTC